MHDDSSQENSDELFVSDDDDGQAEARAQKYFEEKAKSKPKPQKPPRKPAQQKSLSPEELKAQEAQRFIQEFGAKMISELLQSNTLDELGQRLLKPILEKLKNPNAQFSGYEFDTTGVTTHNENAWEQWVFEMCKTVSTNILIYASDISSQFSIGTGEGVIGIALDDPQLNPYTYPGELARKFGRHWDGLIKMGKGIATFVGSIGAAGAEFGGGLGAASAITFTSAGTASPAGIVIVGVTTAAAAATVTAGTAASAAFLTAAAFSMQRAANMKDPHVNPGGPGPNGNDPQQSGGGNGGSGNSGDPQDPKDPKKPSGGNGYGKNPNEADSDLVKFISENNKLPDNYILKSQAKNLGWNPKLGNLDKIAPGKMIGGDIFKNAEKLLPDASNRVWLEADIGYTSGFRGCERIIFSNDGLIYKTVDHYKTFIKIN